MEDAIGLLYEPHTLVVHKLCDKVGMGLVKMDANNGLHDFAPVRDKLIVPRKSTRSPRHCEGNVLVLLQQLTKRSFKLT